MMELLGAFLLTILGFILGIAGIIYMRKNQKKEPLSIIKYYGIQIVFLLFCLLSLAVFWDALTVMSKILKGDHEIVKGDCTVDYLGNYKRFLFRYSFFRRCIF